MNSRALTVRHSPYEAVVEEALGSYGRSVFLVHAVSHAQHLLNEYEEKVLEKKALEDRIENIEQVPLDKLCADLEGDEKKTQLRTLFTQQFLRGLFEHPDYVQRVVDHIRSSNPREIIISLLTEASSPLNIQHLLGGLILDDPVDSFAAEILASTYKGATHRMVAHEEARFEGNGNLSGTLDFVPGQTSVFNAARLIAQARKREFGYHKVSIGIEDLAEPFRPERYNQLIEFLARSLTSSHHGQINSAVDLGRMVYREHNTNSSSRSPESKIFMRPFLGGAFHQPDLHQPLKLLLIQDQFTGSRAYPPPPKLVEQFEGFTDYSRHDFDKDRLKLWGKSEKYAHVKALLREASSPENPELAEAIHQLYEAVKLGMRIHGEGAISMETNIVANLPTDSSLRLMAIGHGAIEQTNLISANILTRIRIQRKLGGEVLTEDLVTALDALRQLSLDAARFSSGHVESISERFRAALTVSAELAEAEQMGKIEGGRAFDRGERVGRK